MSINDLFAALGGYTAVAEAASVPVGTASAWKTRGSIPPEYWPAVVKAAAERGRSDITFEALANIAASRRPARDPAPAESAA